MDLDTEVPCELHQVSTENIKTTLINLHYFADTLEALLVSLQKQEKDDEINDQIKNVEKRLKHIKEQIKSNDRKLAEVAELKNQYTEKLEMPELGINDDYDIEKARLSIPIYKEDSSSVSLVEFWSKLTCFAEAYHLSEEAIKSLLSCLLLGYPYKAFFDNRSKPLKSIITILADRFANIQTMGDKLAILDSIKRDSKETLPSAMQRVSILIDQTANTVPPEDRASRYKLLMQNHLMNLCSAKARNAIIFQRTKASRHGFTLNYQDCFQIAKDQERWQDHSHPSQILDAELNNQ